MDGIYAKYLGQKIEGCYNSSQWTDSAGEFFGSRDIPQMTRELERLGMTGEHITVFIKRAQQLL